MKCCKMKTPASSSSYALGIVFLILVSFLWTICSMVVQHLYQDMEFDSPFLIVYIGTSLFSIFIPMRLVYERGKKFGKIGKLWRCCCCYCCSGNVVGDYTGDGGEEEEDVVIIPWKNTDITSIPTILADGSDWGLTSRSNGDLILDDTSTLMSNVSSNYQNGTPAIGNTGNENGSAHDSIGSIIGSINSNYGRGAVEMNEFDYSEDDDGDAAKPSDSLSMDKSLSGANHSQLLRSGGRSSNHDTNFHSNNNTVSNTLNKNYLLSHQDHISMASRVAPIWFLSNYFYAQSLQWTSIASSTVLASMGSLFAFGFATCSRFGDERVTKGKVLGVLLCFMGGVATALSDVDVGGNSSVSSGDNDDGGDIISGDGADYNGNNHLTTRFLRHPAAHFPQYLTDLTNDSSFLTLLGDMAGLLSAVGYGAYTVLLRHLCPKDEDRMSMQLLFGYIGVWNMVLLFPVAVWVVLSSDGDAAEGNDSDKMIWNDDFSNNMTDTDPFSHDNFPPTTHDTSTPRMENTAHSTLTWSIFLFLLLKGLLDNVLSDYLWARAVILTSATVASVGVGLTIPMAFVADWMMGNYQDKSVSIGDVFGAVFVLLGFLFVNVNVFGEKDWGGEESDDEEEEELDFEMEDEMDAGSASDVEILT